MFIDVVNSLPDAVLVLTDEGGEDRVAWANRAAGKLLHTDARTLLEAPLSALMAEQDVSRVHARLKLRNTAPFRADFLSPGSRVPILVDARVTFEDERFDNLYLLSAREVRIAGRLDELLADLQRAVLEADPRSLADGRALVRALDPVFRARRWSGSLWEAHARHAVLRHIISGWGMGREAWQYAQSLLGQPVPYEHAPVLGQVVSSGRGVFFDDVERVVGEGAARHEGDPSLADRVAGALRARRLSRGAWAPVHTRRGVTHVLTVVGVDMSEADFAAVLLIANQIGAWLSMSELSARLAHEEQRAALAEMSSVVAHEMRAPALILDNTARRLERQISGDTRLEPTVALLRRQIGALDSLVAHLIDHARSLAELRMPSSVSRAIDRALAELGVSSGRDPIDVQLPSPPPIVRAEPLLLAHALVHLVDNALQHCLPGSRVRITVETHPSPDVGEEARIAVSNHGVALPAPVASRMFEPFFSTTGRPGLGLPIARRVATALGGRLELERGEDEVTLSLWLPVEARRLAARTPLAMASGDESLRQ